MAYNLARNSRVFVTTNLDAATGAVKTAGLTTANTAEIQVLDGFSFSQGTATTNVEIKEAGTTPIRGQRAFNTALNPVEISFSTYIRPKIASGTVTAEEKHLWNALLGSVGIEGTTNAVGTTVTGSTVTGTPSAITRAGTSSPSFTITGITILPTLVASQIVSIQGMQGAEAYKYNNPIKVTSYGSGTLVAEWLTSPPVSGTTVTATTVPTTTKFISSAWYTQDNGGAAATPYGIATAATSGKNQLLPIGFIFNVDNAWYTIDNCAMDSAAVDFGLDAIAMVAWTAKGTKLTNLTTPVTVTGSTAFTGGLAGTVVGKDTTAGYITNKLSTVTLKSTLGMVGSGATQTTVVLTGGNFNISNNITYVTPNNIGVVNLPIGYFTGTRAISGTMNAYLRTGSGEVSALLDTMLTNIATSAETKYGLQLEIGGAANGTRVELEMPGVVLGVPSVEIADVVSTAITFNAQGTAKDLVGVSNATYDIENTNDVTIRYYSAV